MRTIHVSASSNYDIVIGKGVLDSLGEECATRISPCRVCIVTDDTVDALYGQRAQASLAKVGFDVIKFVIKHGEAQKNTASLIALVEFLAENRFTRTDMLAALGGGVVGDLCGFAAAVYLRGIRFIQIPTTLLAAVDSSVGGKTAVDLAAGKNLMGAFHQPSFVLCDYSTLDTLDDAIFSDGCAEVIKYGVINDRAFFELIESGIRQNIEEVICRCVLNKAKIVENDEFDNGIRQLLNLGHTVGHAIEACSAFAVSHGRAVATGMAIATRISVALGLCSEDDYTRLASVLSENNLPTQTSFSAEELSMACSTDKKRRGDSISFVLPYGIGDSRLYRVDADKLTDFIQKGL